MQRYVEAIDIVAPSIDKSKIGNRLLPMIKAIALWNMDQRNEARAISNKVIQNAPDELKRSELSKRFNDEFK
jgi:hypothetical protein